MAKIAKETPKKEKPEETEQLTSKEAVASKQTPTLVDYESQRLKLRATPSRKR